MGIGSPQMSSSETPQPKIIQLITSQGSSYNFLEDGTTQRHKLDEGANYPPQSAIVFLPDYETIKRLAPTSFRMQELEFNVGLPGRIQQRGAQNYIVNQKGTKLETNKAIQDEEGPIFLTFGSNDKVDFFFPVSKKPKIGYRPFDTRKFEDPETGELMREKHLGHQIIDIKYE